MSFYSKWKARKLSGRKRSSRKKKPKWSPRRPKPSPRPKPRPQQPAPKPRPAPKPAPKPTPKPKPSGGNLQCNVYAYNNCAKAYDFPIYMENNSSTVSYNQVKGRISKDEYYRLINIYRPSTSVQGIKNFNQKIFRETATPEEKANYSRFRSDEDLDKQISKKAYDERMTSIYGSAYNPRTGKVTKKGGFMGDDEMYFGMHVNSHIDNRPYNTILPRHEECPFGAPNMKYL